MIPVGRHPSGGIPKCCCFVISYNMEKYTRTRLVANEIEISFILLKTSPSQNTPFPVRPEADAKIASSQKSSISLSSIELYKFRF